MVFLKILKFDSCHKTAIRIGIPKINCRFMSTGGVFALKVIYSLGIRLGYLHAPLHCCFTVSALVRQAQPLVGFPANLHPEAWTLHQAPDEILL
jgi:hypothetical protein